MKLLFDKLQLDKMEVIELAKEKMNQKNVYLYNPSFDPEGR